MKLFATSVVFLCVLPGIRAGQTTITQDKLFIERKGKKEELLPESCDIFFRKGVEGRILFRHGSNGKVDALIDRRNNEDVDWQKTT
jgi:hypothetical protein